MISQRPDHQRIVITGVGLTAPNGNSLAEFRSNLLAGRSGVSEYEVRYFGRTLAGVCRFDELRYQRRKDLRRGTRAGSIGIFCAREAIADSGIAWDSVDKAMVGVYVGVTEHGNVETENEIYLIKGYDYNTQFWSHHHNPRTVANNPAGEITLNLGITGPHYTLGAACAAASRRASTRSASSPASIVRGPWPATRTPPRPRAPLTWIATGLWWPRADACSCWNASATPAPAQRASMARCSAMP